MDAYDIIIKYDYIYIYYKKFKISIIIYYTIFRVFINIFIFFLIYFRLPIFFFQYISRYNFDISDISVKLKYRYIYDFRYFYRLLHTWTQVQIPMKHFAYFKSPVRFWSKIESGLGPNCQLLNQWIVSTGSTWLQPNDWTRLMVKKVLTNLKSFYFL